jgi:hypothetical protein
MADDELAGALRQPHVAGIQIGDLADPPAGTQEYLHDRPVAARAETIGLKLHRAQLFP